MNVVIAFAPATLRWLTTRDSGSDSGEVVLPNGASLRCAVPRCQYAVTTHVPEAGAVQSSRSSVRSSLRSTTVVRSSWGLLEAQAARHSAALAPTRLGGDTFVVVVTTPSSIVRSAYVSGGGVGASASNRLSGLDRGVTGDQLLARRVARDVESGYAGRPPTAEGQVDLQPEAVGLGQDRLDGRAPVRVAVLVLVLVDDVVGAIHHEGDLDASVAGLLDLPELPDGDVGVDGAGPPPPEHRARAPSLGGERGDEGMRLGGLGWGRRGGRRCEGQPSGGTAGGDDRRQPGSGTGVGLWSGSSGLLGTVLKRFIKCDMMRVTSRM